MDDQEIVRRINQLADEEHRVHEAVVEEIVAGDDEQLERYLSGEVPTATELERTLAAEVLECAEFPVLLGSAATGVGIDNEPIDIERGRKLAQERGVANRIKLIDGDGGSRRERLGQAQVGIGEARV